MTDGCTCHCDFNDALMSTLSSQMNCFRCMRDAIFGLWNGHGGVDKELDLIDIFIYPGYWSRSYMITSKWYLFPFFFWMMVVSGLRASFHIFLVVVALSLS